MDYTTDELYDLSDEELEKAFKEAKASQDSEDIELENTDNNETEETQEEVFDESTEGEDEEIIEEDLEQPDEQDSDDDSSDEVDEKESDEDSTDADTDPDEEEEAEEENTEEDENDSDKEEQPVQQEVLKFKANGQDYEFTTDEMKQQFGKFFGQAMDYTKKMQKIKPYRQAIDAMEQANVTREDLNLMIDVLKGDEAAIAQILKRTGVDALELEGKESNYTAKDYGRSASELDIKDIVDEISSDREYAITHSVIENKWDDNSRMEFAKNPNLIKLLHIDVKNGVYDVINPVAQKMKAISGDTTKSDLDYYKEAAKLYYSKQQEQAMKEQETLKVDEEAKVAKAEAERIKKVKAKEAKKKEAEQTNKKRKAASPNRKVSSKQITTFDDSDEAYEAWKKQLEDSL